MENECAFWEPESSAERRDRILKNDNNQTIRFKPIKYYGNGFPSIMFYTYYILLVVCTHNACTNNSECVRCARVTMMPICGRPPTWSMLNHSCKHTFSLSLFLFLSVHSLAIEWFCIHSPSDAIVGPIQTQCDLFFQHSDRFDLPRIRYRCCACACVHKLIRYAEYPILFIKWYTCSRWIWLWSGFYPNAIRSKQIYIL